MVDRSRGVVVGSRWIRSHISIPASQFPLTPGSTAAGQRVNYSLPPPEYLDAAIRRSLLYFDYIEWPQNDAVPENDQRFDILVQQGIVERPQIHVVVPQSEALAMSHMRATSGMVSKKKAIELIRDAYVAYFVRRDNAHPGRWGFAPVHPDVEFWGPTQIDVRAVRIQLQNLLPIPHPHVEFADILEFMGRRRGELIALRTYLDGFYHSVCTSRDLPTSRTHALDKLIDTLADLSRVLEESRLSLLRSPMAVDLCMDSVGYGEAAELAAEHLAEWVGAPGIGSTFGIAAGAIRFVRGIVKSPVKRVGPMAYLYHADRECII